jgi:hypothetical protein
MSRPFREAEQTPWLRGERVRRYNPTLVLLGLLIPAVAALVLELEDPDRMWPIALLLVAAAFAGLLALSRRAVRGVRLNNGAVALMTRGEDLGASNAFRAVVKGFFGRDIVGMSLYNLGVLALRSLDLASSISLHRAAIAAGDGFRFRWQPNLAADLSRAQLAFVLAASGEQLEEAASSLEAGKGATSPLAIAFAVRARAMLAARRGRFEEVLDVLDGERALLRNVLPLNDAVLCEALASYAVARLGNTYRGGARVAQPVLADDLARAYVRRMLPEAETVLVSM